MFSLNKSTADHGKTSCLLVGYKLRSSSKCQLNIYFVTK